tara:strand:+ start:7383 stop:7544 length:162 start_codon:yes stop_codon:yes gene_type:complete
MEFEFDKFMKDLEKREKTNRSEMTQSEIEYHQLIMKRNFNNRELPQNRTVWRR